MSQNVKMIPCRQCGKMYKPCAYCQENEGVWRWRNFCCSLECARKYVKSAEAYREAQNRIAARESSRTVEKSVIAEEPKTVKEVMVDNTIPTTKKKSDRNTAKTTSDEVTNDKETTK